MLQNGARTHRSGENRSSHQNLYQEEDFSTFSSIQMKARGSSSSLMSAKPMATKVSVGLDSDFRGSGSSHTLNSSLQQQTATGNTSKHFRQHRPSVLRKGNHPFPQVCSVNDWVVDTVCKTEPDSDLSDPVPLYTSQSESRLSTSMSNLQSGSTEHAGKHGFSVPGGFLCVKGQCGWPGCSKGREVFKEYGLFLKHLSTDHAPGDRSIAQLRMQKDKVQYMENQLTAERQKLQAMQLHLFDVKSTSEDGNSMEKSGHLSGLLQPAACQNANDGVYDSDRAAAEALTQGYWQISTSQVIPGIIPSFEYYKFTNMRPPFTYASMIRWAILESPEKQLTLNEIYHWFTRMFFYFRHNTATWKNAVRHNLSLHKCFVRVEGRKGSVWTVDEEEFQRKRSASPSGQSESTLPKQAKVSEEEPRNDSQEDAEPEKVGNGEPKHESVHPKDAKDKDVVIRNEADAQESTGGGESARQPSDSAAIAAAEALASLTGGDRDGDEDCKEMPCSSNKASREKSRDKSNRPGCSQSERRTEAAAADSSSSLLLCEDREDPEQASFVDDDDDEEEEEDDDSLPGSSSTASSSVASDNEDNEDGECAIVSVKMAPEVRQSVALLAQVQMRLDALEKKGARLHQRLEIKLSRQRRPHLDQRSAITQAIPGFWVTALLNHPHLSAQIDETDEDALSYMTNLEIESFKNNKLGYRICFHFRRNPFFQNKMIVKELHLGMGGSPVSFSNPILWHRGQNLVGSGEPRRTSQGVYQSFFHWFSDHSNPGRDDIAQILKDDLYRNPLRYYLTPLWEPRENGSGAPKPQGSNNGDECVIISDSDEDEEQKSQNLEQDDDDDDDDDDQDRGSDENDRDEEESSCEEREEEEVDVEEVEESRDSGGCEVREQGQEEEDIDVDEEKS